MVHAYQRRPKPLCRSETERIENFLDLDPAPGVTATLNGVCRQLRDQGVSQEEIAAALFCIGASYVDAMGVPLEAQFTISRKRLREE